METKEAVCEVQYGLRVSSYAGEWLCFPHTFFACASNHLLSLLGICTSIMAKSLPSMKCASLSLPNHHFWMIDRTVIALLRTGWDFACSECYESPYILPLNVKTYTWLC